MSFVPEGLIEQARQEAADRERRRVRRTRARGLRSKSNRCLTATASYCPSTTSNDPGTDVKLTTLPGP